MAGNGLSLTDDGRDLLQHDRRAGASGSERIVKDVYEWNGKDTTS